MSKTKIITRTRAAKIIGVKPVTIEDYLRKGYLNRIVIHGRIYVDKDEAEALKAGLNSPVKDVNGVIVSKLTAIIREQQKDIEVIKRILNMYNEPLDMEDFSIEALYKAAIELRFESWPEDWIDEWIATIIRMRCEDLFQLEKITNDEHPWKPFLKLIIIIQDVLRKEKKFDVLETANSARAHLDEIINVWCQVKNKPSRNIKLEVAEFGKIAIYNIRERYLKLKSPKK